MVKFIHCSDLHLDSPFKSKSHISPKIFEDVQKSAYESFKNIVDIALQQDVDFVIIAGDLFDSENRTLRAEIFLKQQFERLQNEQIFVYVCHGNHDPLSSKISSNWPDNVSVFSNKVETYEAITKSGETIYIHGFSYENRASYENKIDEYPSSQGQKGIHIGVLHGTYSKSSVNERYTEFILEDLNSKLYHYWALGHIHERQQLSDMPVINYSGNIQGRHFNEQGEKGCLLIEGDHLKLKTKFILHSILDLKKQLLKRIRHLSKVYTRSFKTLKNKWEKKESLYRLTLVINSETLISPQDLLQVEEMITDYEENENQFVYIDELKIQYAQNDESPLVNEFSAELLVDQTVFDKAMSDLYLNPRASKFLDDYGTFDHTALVNRAEEILKAEMRGEQNDN